MGRVICGLQRPLPLPHVPLPSATIFLYFMGISFSKEGVSDLWPLR